MAGFKPATKAIILLFIFLQFSAICESATLSTRYRWIVDQGTGNRVKLTCANWAGHLQAMVPEGLEKKPVSYIASQIAKLGFNCVRLTWATFMFTRPEYSNLKVSAALDKFNLAAAKSGIGKNNPQFLEMNVIDVQKAVVNELGKNNLMVVLDNHVSLPGWCCGDDDGNGFFGDANFDPNEWLQGLTAVARAYKGNSAVVGMSLRNELRGNRQNTNDWYKNMAAGAQTVHTQNPDVLVIVSGLSYDSDLSFLKQQDLQSGISNKIVYEAHWYTFGTGPDKWDARTNQLCADFTKNAQDKYFFVTTKENSYPLFLSEFGIDQRGTNEADNRYISCLLAAVAEIDIDWSIWAIQGSYILREGNADVEETYGVMNFNWDGPKNPAFVDRLQILKQVNQGANSKNPGYYIMLHPQSGKCVQIGNNNNVILANCNTASRWDQHQDGGPLKLSGSSLCLAVAGDGGATSVSDNCTSKWKYVSSSGLQLAAQDGMGKYFCLEMNGSDHSTVITKKCLCVTDDLGDFSTCADNPEVQWFKLVPANV
ncbi:hypothetical protein ABFS83_01G065600 [Erythranthe nasuta]